MLAMKMHHPGEWELPKLITGNISPMLVGAFKTKNKIIMLKTIIGDISLRNVETSKTKNKIIMLKPIIGDISPR